MTCEWGFQSKWTYNRRLLDLHPFLLGKSKTQLLQDGLPYSNQGCSHVPRNCQSPHECLMLCQIEDFHSSIIIKVRPGMSKVIRSDSITYLNHNNCFTDHQCTFKWQASMILPTWPKNSSIHSLDTSTRHHQQKLQECCKLQHKCKRSLNSPILIALE